MPPLESQVRRLNSLRFCAPITGFVTLGLCLLAVIATAGCRSGASSWVVHPDGRIGPLRIDVSTESDVRDFAGNPFKVARVLAETGPKAVGHELYYRCGRDCVTVYAISKATGKLADFLTQSRAFASEGGSHVGMPARRAVGAEHRPIVGACGEGRAIHLRWDDHHIFVLTVFARKVSMIVYLGPRTLSYEGLC
jgi:hypothetical protein